MTRLKDVLPKSLPAEWQIVRQEKDRAVYNQVVLTLSTISHRHFHKDGTGEEIRPRQSLRQNAGLCVIVHTPERMNGREWMHVVVTVAPVAGNTKPSSYPLINDLDEVRRLFFGEKKTATMLLKPELQQEFSVHLWAEVEARTLIRA